MTLPVRTVEQARSRVTAELAAIVAIMVAAAADHTHDPNRAHMTTAPCGQKGGYKIAAFDGFLLPPDQHLTVAEILRHTLADAGYTVDRLDTTPSGGIQLSFHNQDYEATIASGAGNDSISVYLMSACQITPDSQFPLA
ncbi:hypothetical protein AB0M47_04765 [Hamadaea sp. NPDC051192]|uniref:hypothetical protein n=1 Tax=Hamadaea sp. NPDC051192 TaxID=3154940 RepID=UPI003438BF21